MFQLVNVTKFYEGERILNRVNLTMNERDVIVIQGKSGSGKSTLLNILSGLEQPDQGQVLIDKRSFYSLTEREQAAIRARDIGYVFQKFHLLQEWTAEDNMLFPFKLMKQTYDTAYYEYLVKVLQIEKLVHKKVAKLSGGEQQRVALVRAFLTKPRLLVADEPTGSLDEGHSRIVMEAMLQLAHEVGTALVIVTHDPNLVRQPTQKWFIKQQQLVMHNE